MIVNRAFSLTAPGAAAISVVRIVGPGVIPFLQGHFSKNPRPMRCVHGELRDGERVIDDAVVVLHEDNQTADLNLHGGPWVVASVFELLKSNGFERAEPTPELLDGSTILQQEVHFSLPLAKTEEGVRMLLAQPAAWERFVDSNPTPGAIDNVLKDQSLRRLLHPPRVAIIGAPNVGKSTLGNQLFSQQRSITADVPGTTRDWVGEIANIDGLPVMLIDTPGLRQTEDSIEHAAIEMSGAIIADADLIIHVRDASSAREGEAPAEPFSGERPARQEPRPPGGVLIVMNKLDRVTQSDMQYDVGTVATSGVGVEMLRTRIRERLNCADLTPDRPRCWTDRQIAALQRDPRDVLVGHQ